MIFAACIAVACGTYGARRVRGERAVLHLRDSTLVAALRAHRPRVAEFIMDRFDRRVLRDNAMINYVDP